MITAGVLWATSQILPAFTFIGGIRGFLIGTLAFMLANILLIPLLKVLLLPLNLLTLGLFAWLSNVIALYVVVNLIPSFQVLPYFFPGVNIVGFAIPSATLSIFQVVIVASILISLMINFVRWLIK